MPDEGFEFGHLTLRFVFRDTLTGGPPGDWTFSPVTEIPTPHGPPLLARDSDGNCHVLVPIDDNEALDTDDKSVGVCLAAQMLTVDGETGRYVDLRCEGPAERLRHRRQRPVLRAERRVGLLPPADG